MSRLTDAQRKLAAALGVGLFACAAAPTAFAQVGSPARFGSPISESYAGERRIERAPAADPARDDPDDGGIRLALGAFGGAALFSFNLDLGGNNEIGLAPHGAAAWGLRLGADFGRTYSLQVEARQSRSTYYRGGATADLLSVRGTALVHVGGERWRPFLLVGAGLEMLTNDPAPIRHEQDAAIHLGLGLRYEITPWFGLRGEGRLLLSDGKARDSWSRNWELLGGATFRLFGT